METNPNPPEKSRKNPKGVLAGAAFLGLTLAAFSVQAWACGGLFCARKKTEVGVSAAAIPALAAATEGGERAAGPEKTAVKERRVTLKVAGLSCSSCEYRAKKVLKKVPGVKEAEISAKRGQADVVFDPALAKVEDLIEAIDGAGYQASLPDSSAGG